MLLSLHNGCDTRSKEAYSEFISYWYKTKDFKICSRKEEELGCFCLLSAIEITISQIITFLMIGDQVQQLHKIHVRLRNHWKYLTY